MKEVFLNKARVAKKLSSEPRNNTREVELEASEGGTLRVQGTLKWNWDSHTGLPN